MCILFYILLYFITLLHLLYHILLYVVTLSGCYIIFICVLYFVCFVCFVFAFVFCSTHLPANPRPHANFQILRRNIQKLGPTALGWSSSYAGRKMLYADGFKLLRGVKKVSFTACKLRL